MPTLLEKRLLHFLFLSVGLHGFLFLTWKEPLKFDLGGQQANQQVLEIALAPPPEPPVKTQPVEESPPPPEPEPEPEPEPTPEPPQPEAVEPSVEPTVAEPPPEPLLEVAPKEIAIQPEPLPEPSPLPKPEPKPATPKAEPESPPKAKRQYVPFQEKKLARKRVEKLKKKNRPPPKPVQKVTPPQPKTAPPQPKAVPPPPKAKPAPKIVEAEALKQSQATIRRLIQAELVNHFQYPRLARRKGWEGLIHLEFTVQPDGKLTNIQVLKGSRYGLLNRSAVDTMVRINQLHQISEGMLSGPVRMELPIIYQLSNQ